LGPVTLLFFALPDRPGRGVPVRIPALAVLALLSACAAAPPILVSEPGSVTPASLGSYEFQSSEAAREAGSGERRADTQLAALVARKLDEKGYVRAAAGSEPDFIVTFRIAVFTSENTRDAYAQVRDPTSLIGTDIAPDPAGSEGLVREATLVLMALAGSQEKVIWQATASGVATSRRELTAGALRTAAAMLDRFPQRIR
jgi:hypothetical protein